MSLSYLAPILESFTCRVLARPLISLLACSDLAIAILEIEETTQDIERTPKQFVMLAVGGITRCTMHDDQ
jgi:hypothetical protein